MTASFRTEHDSMGELQVPAAALWGAQTQRAVENFPISGRPMPRGFIRALGLVKAAAAEVNAGLGLLPKGVAKAVRDAALRVADGEFDEHFPIDIYQTGSGTSSNMNANEVIATLASQAGKAKVHPNDHVNLGQSSNDVIPTAIRVSAQLAVVENLLPALKHLRRTIDRRGKCIGESGQDRPHPPDGCDAADLPAGILGLVGAIAVGRGPDPGQPQAPAPPAAGRNRDRHRHQCRSAFRGEGGAFAVAAGRDPFRIGGEQVRRPGGAGRCGGVVGPAQCACGRPDQDRQRPALDEFRAAGRAWAKSNCPPCNPAARSCRARSIR